MTEEIPKSLEFIVSDLKFTICEYTYDEINFGNFIVIYEKGPVLLKCISDRDFLSLEISNKSDRDDDDNWFSVRNIAEVFFPDTCSPDEKEEDFEESYLNREKNNEELLALFKDKVTFILEKFNNDNYKKTKKEIVSTLKRRYRGYLKRLGL